MKLYSKISLQSLLILLLFINSITLCFAQSDTIYIDNRTYDNQNDVYHSTTLKTNEIKVNGLSTLLGIPEITYERILSRETAAGVSLALDLGSSLEYNFMLTPYYRIYFGREDNASGCFLEGNGSVFSYDNYYYNSYINDNYKTEIGYGLGLAVGKKFMTRSQNWFGEIVFGIGRNFSQSDKESGVIVYPRVGINIGRRF